MTHSPAKRADALWLARKGVCAREIGERLVVSPEIVRKWCHAAGVALQRPTAWPESRLNALREMRRRGMSRRECADALGTTMHALNLVIHKHGLARQERAGAA